VKRKSSGAEDLKTTPVEDPLKPKANGSETIPLEDPPKPKADGSETIPLEDPLKPKADGSETIPLEDPPKPKADGLETTPVEEHLKSEADSVKSQANSTAEDLKPKNLWGQAYKQLQKKNEKLVDRYARFLQYPHQQGTIIMIGFSEFRLKDFRNFLQPSPTLQAQTFNFACVVLAWPLCYLEMDILTACSGSRRDLLIPKFF
jgi:hypothetical protein